MTDEGQKKHDERGDWTYPLPTSRFGHQSYEYIRWLGRIKGQNTRSRQNVGHALTNHGVGDLL